MSPDHDPATRPQPILEDGFVVLRPPRPEDKEARRAYGHHPEFVRLDGDDPRHFSPLTPEDLDRWYDLFRADPLRWIVAIEGPLRRVRPFPQAAGAQPAGRVRGRTVRSGGKEDRARPFLFPSSQRRREALHWSLSRGPGNHSVANVDSLHILSDRPWGASLKMLRSPCRAQGLHSLTLAQTRSEYWFAPRTLTRPTPSILFPSS
jgi:hypothetical protein